MVRYSAVDQACLQNETEAPFERRRVARWFVIARTCVGMLQRQDFGSD